MKKKIRNVLAALGILIMLSAIPARAMPVAHESEEGMRAEEVRPKEEFTADITKELNLTKEQKTLLKQARHELKKKKMEAQHQLRIKRMDLRYELDQDKIDVAKIDTIISEINTLQGTLLRLRVENILKMKEVLTPEQYEALNSLDRRTSRRGRGRKQGRGRGGFGKMFGRGQFAGREDKERR